MKYVLVIMLINGWGPNWTTHEFPDRESCERAITMAKVSMQHSDMKGNHLVVFCRPKEGNRK